MKRYIRSYIFPSRFIRWIIILAISIYIIIDGRYSLFKKRNKNESSTSLRGVVVTLVRSTDRSISLAMNMMHSVVKFHTVNNSYPYPFLIFHDQNFTSSMREHILSCMLKSNKNIQISFALINLHTTAVPDAASRKDKPVGYRLMCRFWTYDVFHHPAIVQGHYDYLMRMDDDSFFSDVTKKDIFLYMSNRTLDYVYRAQYWESFDAMHPALKSFIGSTRLPTGCIYNNFFVIRLKWFYENKRVQEFLRHITQDNEMIRQYIGDGCAHSGMLAMDSQVRTEIMKDIPYGHNYHAMPSGMMHWSFREVREFYNQINNSCHQLTVIRGSEVALIKTNMS
jgi:hypothetical protein